MTAHEVPANHSDSIKTQEIRDILEVFVSKKASNDTTIGEDLSSVLASFVEEHESARCKEVAQVLVGIADEIDIADGRLQDLMGKVGTPQLAFRTFQSVARTLFSWSPTGVVNVTWQRIAALLGFCYQLCRQFLLTDNNQRAIRAFFTAVVGYLTRFLLEGQLLNWIHSRGGWMSILHYRPPTTPGLTAVATIGLTTVAVAGVSLYVYNYLTS